MSYVIKAVLSNPRRPEHGQMTILFPIPDSEYDHTIELLEAMGSGAPTAQDCRVDELDSSYPILNRLLAQSVSVDELDYLAKRLDSFCEGEDSPFEAMAHKLGISTVKDFINLTFCCQQATVITDFSNLEQIGRDHRMNINGGSMPVEEYRALDGREEAVRLIESGGGTVTPYGVVYDNGMVLEQLYNGRQFPAYIYMPPVIALEVTPKQGLSEGQNPEYLCLPAASRQIERALLRAGIHPDTIGGPMRPAAWGEEEQGSSVSGRRADNSMRAAMWHIEAPSRWRSCWGTAPYSSAGRGRRPANKCQEVN